MGNSTHMIQKVFFYLPVNVSANKTSVCRGESLLAGKQLCLRLILSSGGKGPYQFLQQLNTVCSLPAYLGFE